MSLEGKATRLISAHVRLDQSVNDFEKNLESDNTGIISVVRFAGVYALALFHGVRYRLAEETFMHAVATSEKDLETFFPIDQAKELLEVNGVDNGK